MKYKVTLTPEAAATLLGLYETGQLDEIGITRISHVAEEGAHEAGPSADITPQTATADENTIAVLRVLRVSPGDVLGFARWFYAECIVREGQVEFTPLEIYATKEYQVVPGGLEPSYWMISYTNCKGGRAQNRRTCEVRLLTNSKYSLKEGDFIVILNP